MPSTCNTNGSVTMQCACGDKKTTELELDGSKHEKLVKDAAVAATCKDTGLTEGEHCEVCGVVTVAQTAIEALGHKYNGTVTLEPTCTTEGIMTYTCANDASHTYTKEIAVIPHIDENNDGYCDSCTEFVCEHTETKLVNVNPATCEFEGYTGDKVCTKCSLRVSKGEVVAPYGHSFNSTPAETIEATCTNAKTYIYKCKYCTATYSESVGAFAPHHIVVITDTEPTCQKPGSYVHFCLNCHTNVQVTEIAPTGHVDADNDGKCDVFGCGGVIEGSGSASKCTCLCHNENAFMKFIYKIVCFIWKLLGLSRVCACGTVHY